MTNATDILRARRQNLAQPLQDDVAQNELQIVVFYLADERYAFETSQVREVFPVPVATQIAPLPGAPLWVRGILNVRGHILAVLNLQNLFGLSGPPHTSNAPVVILRGAPRGVGNHLQNSEDDKLGAIQVGQAGDVALATNGVVGVRTLPDTQLEAGHALEGTPGARYLRGLTSEGIALLDAALFFADEQLLVQAA